MNIALDVTLLEQNKPKNRRIRPDKRKVAKPPQPGAPASDAARIPEPEEPEEEQEDLVVEISRKRTRRCRAETQKKAEQHKAGTTQKKGLVVAGPRKNNFEEMARSLRPKRQKINAPSADPVAGIDGATMTLGDVICRATSIADTAQKKHRKEVAEKRRKEEELKAQKKQAGGDTQDDTQEAAENPPPAGTSLAPKLVMRDGKIVVDEASLRVKATKAFSGLREFEEDDTDAVINSHSFLPVSKLSKERWTKEDTELFYQILGSYGSDFTFMATCFKGRTRKQVKNKYLKEKKINPTRVSNALTTPCDVEVLKRLAEKAQNGNASSDLGPDLLGTKEDHGKTQNMPSGERELDDDDEMSGEDVNPGFRSFFY